MILVVPEDDDVDGGASEMLLLAVSVELTEPLPEIVAVDEPLAVTVELKVPEALAVAVDAEVCVRVTEALLVLLVVALVVASAEQVTEGVDGSSIGGSSTSVWHSWVPTKTAPGKGDAIKLALIEQGDKLFAVAVRAKVTLR